MADPDDQHQLRELANRLDHAGRDDGARYVRAVLNAVDQLDRTLPISWWQLGGGVPDPAVVVPPIRTATYAGTLRGMILARPSRRRILDHLLGPAEAEAVLAGRAVLRPDVWRVVVQAIELAEAAAPVQPWRADDEHRRP